MRGLVPRICTRAELESMEAQLACSILGEKFQLSRKLWEYVVLYEGFRELRLFKPRCLGFGVGQEPLPAAFARLGAIVLATDQPKASASSLWVDTGQHGEAAHHGGRNVEFREIDMRAIPADLHDRFDMVWSSCALEHLGGLRAGETFVLEAMRCLRPGGWALHTTELNVSSLDHTIDGEDLCLYRRRDLERLLHLLDHAGHYVSAPDWTLKAEAPGADDGPHLSVCVGDYVTTSFFFAAQKRFTSSY
jgi:2-polyprenyl-3-methyl-5-hydroxy-6-metoxy-1,4-benzoquinol methylase